MKKMKYNGYDMLKFVGCGILIGAGLMSLACDHCDRKASKRAGGVK